MVLIVSCGVIDKNIKYPIISIVTYFIIILILINEKPALLNYNIIFIILNSFSKFLAIIPHIYQRKKSKKLIKSKDYNEKRKKLKFHKFLFILIIALIDIILSLIEIFDFHTELDLWVLDVIIINIFSKCILKIKLYKHQYLLWKLLLL